MQIYHYLEVNKLREKFAQPVKNKGKLEAQFGGGAIVRGFGQNIYTWLILKTVLILVPKQGTKISMVLKFVRLRCIMFKLVISQTMQLTD